MEENTAAFIHKIAPNEMPSRWNQKAIKRLLSEWEETRSEDYRLVLESEMFRMVPGFVVTAYDLGKNGWDTNFQFVSDGNMERLDEGYEKELAGEYLEEWMENIQKVIEEEQEQTIFSAKEYATYLAYRHPSYNEARAADALGISVGTYRGKVGRVKSKLETVHSTNELIESMPNPDEGDDWERETHGANLKIIDRVEEARLPVSGYAKIEGRDMDEVDIEELIIDD